MKMCRKKASVSYKDKIKGCWSVLSAVFAVESTWLVTVRALVEAADGEAFILVAVSCSTPQERKIEESKHGEVQQKLIWANNEKQSLKRHTWKCVIYPSAKLDHVA